MGNGIGAGPKKNQSEGHKYAWQAQEKVEHKHQRRKERPSLINFLRKKETRTGKKKSFNITQTRVSTFDDRWCILIHILAPCVIGTHYLHTVLIFIAMKISMTMMIMTIL